MAMYDNDILSDGDDFTPLPNYLRSSADIIRDHAVHNSPEMTDELDPNNLIDVEIRLVQFANGPEFRHFEFTRREKNRFRLNGNNLYPDEFIIRYFASPFPTRAL